MKDHRLDLGRYISNPFNKRGEVGKRLDFNDLFQSKSFTGEYPWSPSRFGADDLRRRTQTKKLTQNPDLNFVGNSPYFQNGVQVKEPFEVFEGLGYFSHKDYDFEVGRARIEANPKNQPDFDPNWVEAYRLSPTVDPSKTAKNVMPRDSNPDPRGYIMRRAERDAEAEVNPLDNVSVASLLAGDVPGIKASKASAEEGKKDVEDVEDKKEA
jgi:hypothetical protein